MRKFVPVLLATALFILPCHAQAATIDAAGAAQTKKVIQDAIDLQLRMTQSTGQGLKMDGEIEVTPKGSYYEVKLPNLAMASTENGNLNIGTVMMNVTPADNGDYLASVALPSSMRLTDAAGAEKMTVKLGSQKFSGVWRPSLETFTKMDAEYKDLTATLSQMATGSEGPMMMTIGSVRTIVNMTESGENTWSGPRTTVMEKIDIRPSTNSTSRITLAKLVAGMEYDKVDLSIAKTIKDQLRQKLNSTESVPSPQEAQELFKATMGDMNTFPNGVKNSFEVTGVNVDILPTPRNGEPVGEPLKFTLASARGSSVFNNIKAEKGDARFLLNLTGLDVIQSAAELKGLIPTAANFDITMNNLPMKEMAMTFINIIGDTMQSSLAAQDGATDAATRLKTQQAMLAIPQQLKTAGSSIVVKDTYVNAPTVNSTLEGQFTALPTAAMIAAGDMTLKIRGLEEVIAQLKAASENTPNPKAAGYAQALILLQMAGQMTQGEDGKPLRTYKLEVTPDGKVLMNGAPISDMIQSFGGGGR